MLIKLKTYSRTRLSRQLFDPSSTRRNILALFPNEYYTKLYYKDPEGEFVEIIDDDDLLACVEMCRIDQAVVRSDDIVLTLYVVMPGEDPKSFGENEPAGLLRAGQESYSGYKSGSPAKGEAIKDRSRSPSNQFDKRNELNSLKRELEEISNAYDSSHRRERTPQRGAVETSPKRVTFKPTTPANEPKSDAKELIQLLLFRLFTEKDESVLRNEFPLLFELDGSSIGKPGRIMSVIKRIQGTGTEYMSPVSKYSYSPARAMNPYPATSGYNTFQDSFVAPVGIYPPQPDPQQYYNPNYLYQPQDPQLAGQDPYSSIPQYPNYISPSMPAATPSPEKKGEPFSDKDAKHAEEFTRDQQYFIAKLKQYLHSDKISASAVYWIRANLLTEVRDRDKQITQCYLDIIRKMEKLKVIAPPKKRVMPPQVINEDGVETINAQNGIITDPEAEEDVPAKIAKNDRYDMLDKTPSNIPPMVLRDIHPRTISKEREIPRDYDPETFRLQKQSNPPSPPQSNMRPSQPQQQQSPSQPPSQHNPPQNRLDNARPEPIAVPRTDIPGTTQPLPPPSQFKPTAPQAPPPAQSSPSQPLHSRQPSTTQGRNTPTPPKNTQQGNTINRANTTVRK